MDKESLVHTGVEISDHMWFNYTLPSRQLVFENTFDIGTGSMAFLPSPFSPRTPIVPPHYSANLLSQTPKGGSKPPLHRPHPKILSKQEIESYYRCNLQVKSFYTYLTGHWPVQSHGVTPPDPEWLAFTMRSLAPGESDLEHLMWGQEKYVKLSWHNSKSVADEYNGMKGVRWRYEAI